MITQRKTTRTNQGSNQNVKILYFAELFWRRKKTLKSEQDLNPGLLNSSQMLLPTESLELWHWRKGKMVYIHRHSSNLKLDLFVKALLCMVSVKTLTILRLRCFLHQTGYQLPLCMCSHIKYVWFWRHMQHTMGTPTWRKKTLRSGQDSNLALLNAGQMLLPTEPLELWYWSRG